MVPMTVARASRQFPEGHRLHSLQFHKSPAFHRRPLPAAHGACLHCRRCLHLPGSASQLAFSSPPPAGTRSCGESRRAGQLFLADSPGKGSETTLGFSQGASRAAGRILSGVALLPRLT